jgi:ArsR family transcriptional regulator
VEIKSVTDAVDSGLARRIKHLVDSGLCMTEGASEYTSRLIRISLDIASSKDKIKRASKILKALAHPARLKILKILSNRDMCVCEIMAILNATQPTTSHHLGMLEKLELVRKRHIKKWVFYSIADTEIMNLVQQLVQQISQR